jgi:hypothetical protein
MKNSYWLLVGLLVGIYSVFMGYINLQIIMASDAVNDFNYFGILVVIAQYAVIIYLLSFGQKYFKK